MANNQQLDNRKELIRIFNHLAYKHGANRVFEDFLSVSALSISNAVDKTHWEEREAEYMEITKRYEKSEIELFVAMLTHLVLELEQYAESPKDVLGSIFHELELHNKYKGQFFTPQNIADMMSEVTFETVDKQAIDEQGYVSVCEPCAGSGVMVLSFARAMKKRGYNFQTDMVVTAIDIDIKCVHMAYLQFSLYGIPAIVIHGNSLTREVWSYWYTPLYVLGGWHWKTRNNKKAEGNTKKPVHEVKLRESETGQLAFDI